MLQGVVGAAAEDVEPVRSPGDGVRVGGDGTAEGFRLAPADAPFEPPVLQRAVRPTPEDVKPLRMPGHSGRLERREGAAERFGTVPADAVPPPVLQRRVTAAGE